MGERSDADQIEQHIYETRNELGENIDELQQKVKRTFDWRTQFQERPMALMGAAFGGGLLVALLLPSRRSSSRYSGSERWRPQRWRQEGRQLEYGSEDYGRSSFAEKTAGTWDSVRSALLTAGVNRLTAFVEELLPGFQDQFRRRQSERRYTETPNWRRTNGPEAPGESGRAWGRNAGGETNFGNA